MPCIAGNGPAAKEHAAPLPAAAAASAATEAAAALGEGRKKKKQKTKHAAEKAAAAELGVASGIALFGGQQGQEEAEPRAAADATAAFVDSEPHVATGDPYEEANVIRKAHKIKVSWPRSLEAWDALG